MVAYSMYYSQTCECMAVSSLLISFQTSRQALPALLRFASHCPLCQAPDIACGGLWGSVFFKLWSYLSEISRFIILSGVQTFCRALCPLHSGHHLGPSLSVIFSHVEKTSEWKPFEVNKSAYSPYLPWTCPGC